MYKRNGIGLPWESHCVSSWIISVEPKNKMNLNVLLFLSSLFAAKQWYVAVLICKESSISHIQECRKTLLLQSICSSHICLPLLIFQENTPSNGTQFVSYRLVCTLFSFFPQVWHWSVCWTIYRKNLGNIECFISQINGADKIWAIIECFVSQIVIWFLFITPWIV